VQSPVSASIRGSAPGDLGSGSAWFAGLHARGLIQVSDDPAVLEHGGWWAVMITFEGEYRFWRFAEVEPGELPEAPPWRGPAADGWRSSLDRVAYEQGVDEIRERIRDGEVYQVNLCRVLTADLPGGSRSPLSPAEQSLNQQSLPEPSLAEQSLNQQSLNQQSLAEQSLAEQSLAEQSLAEPSSSPWGLARRLAAGNPAPYSGVIDVPAVGGLPPTRVVCASPELFLERDGDLVRSGPIKGTGATEADLLPKDEAENVMIVDLVRNDLQRVSRAGTVAVPALLQIERHPGLVHLVSTVEARLREEAGWADLLRATLPPGSVSGAPKSSALRAIADLEPVPRGPYCGAIGFIDADRGYARLAVGIRTFWWQDRQLCFGTGAGITWGSDPSREWAETELKAARLIGLASDHPRVDGRSGDQVSSRATAASRSR
jgi:para-aminobenzoate synthetase component 1